MQRRYAPGSNPSASKNFRESRKLVEDCSKLILNYVNIKKKKNMRSF